MDLPQEAENALVAQKDALLAMVNDERFEEAMAALAVVQRFWRAVGYGYKADEVRQRIRDGIDERIRLADHWNTRQRLGKLRLRVA